MHKNGHAHLRFIDAMAHSFEHRIVVIKARVNFSNRTKDAALVVLRRIADARPVAVAILIVSEAAAIAVIQTSAGEILRVLDIGGTAKPNAGLRFESSQQRRDDRLLLRWSETRVVFDHIANRSEISLYLSNVRRVRVFA